MSEKLENNISDLWNIFNDKQSLIKYADQKVGFLVALNGIITSFLFSTFIDKESISKLDYILLGIFSLIFLVFIFTSVWIVFSRYSAQEDSKMKRMVFFGHISSNKNAKEFYNTVKDATTKDIFKDLSYQVYGLSVIAKKKFDLFRICCWLTFMQFLVFIVLLWQFIV